MGSDSNNRITKSLWASVFKASWEAAMTPDNIKNGFKACGIFPLNPDIIPKSAFAPSEAFINENTLESAQSSSAVTLPVENVLSEDTDNICETSKDKTCIIQDSIPILAEKSDEPHIEISFPQDMTATATAENLEAAHILLNLSFSGSELVDSKWS